MKMNNWAFDELINMYKCAVEEAQTLWLSDYCCSREEADLRKAEDALKIKEVIVKCTNAEELNNAMELILAAKHALGSKEELRTHLINKAKELGATLDPQTRKYTDSAN